MLESPTDVIFVEKVFNELGQSNPEVTFGALFTLIKDNKDGFLKTKEFLTLNEKERNKAQDQNSYCRAGSYIAQLVNKYPDRIKVLIDELVKIKDIDQNPEYDYIRVFLWTHKTFLENRYSEIGNSIVIE